MSKEGADEGKPLSHTTGELRRIEILESRKTEPGKEVPRFGQSHLFGTPVDPRCKDGVVDRCTPREKSVGLWHVGDAIARVSISSTGQYPAGIGC